MPFNNAPLYMPLGEPQFWVTDKTMPMICSGWPPTCRIEFYVDTYRVEIRQHYTEVRMSRGYHMNDNKVPPFYWSKPR